MTTSSQRLADLAPPRGVEAVGAVTDGYKAYQALCTAIEAGLFPWLATNGPTERKIILAALGMRGMYMSSFLQTLVDARLLELDGDRYGLTPAARDCLLPGGVWYQGDAVLALKGPHSPWSALTTLLCEDPAPSAQPDAAGVRRLRAGQLLRGEVQAVARTLSGYADFLTAGSLLDLGGGFGMFAIALCQLNRDLSATVLAAPDDLELTRALVAEHGLGASIAVLPGHPLESDLGMGHDVVLAAHAFYGVRQQVGDVFHRAAGALRPGGLLVSCHWFCKEGCEPSSSGLRDMDKCVTAGGHPLCHVERFGGLMREAGFGGLSQLDFQGPYGLGKLHLGTLLDAAAGRKAGGTAGRGCGC